MTDSLFLREAALGTTTGELGEELEMAWREPPAASLEGIVEGEGGFMPCLPPAASLEALAAERDALRVECERWEQEARHWKDIAEGWQAQAVGLAARLGPMQAAASELVGTIEVDNIGH